MREILLPAVLIWNRARMRLPLGASCERCAAWNPLVLIESQPSLCYRCELKARGLSGHEDHHIGGRPSPFPPVPIDANLHRILSVFQEVWRQRSVPPGHPVAAFLDFVFLVVALAGWDTNEKF